MPYRFFEGKPVGDSRLCATHWGLWREVLFLSDLHFTVTPPPYPPQLWNQARLRKGRKIQLKTPFSHLERPTGRVKEGRCGLEQNELFPKNKQRKPSRSQVLELESNPGEGTRRKLRHGGKSESRREGDPGISSGMGVGSSCLVSGACESPLPQSRALSSWLPYLGLPAARCRSLGRVSRSPAPDSSGSMSRAGGPL